MYEALDVIPLLVLFFLIIGLTFLAIEAGYRLGRWRRGQTDDEKEAPVGTAVAATLGLLAFLVAFTFGLAASRFEARRSVLLDEVNAIGTAYLRAGLLAEPHRANVRGILREYVDVRLEAVEKGDVEAAKHRSEELHERLWTEVVAVGESDPRSVPIGLFIESINDVIDLHSKRVLVALRSRIPAIIWFSLVAVSIVTHGAMGYQAGLARTSRSLVSTAVVVAFAIIIWLIAALDRPHRGLIAVSQQGMFELKQSMAAPAK